MHSLERKINYYQFLHLLSGFISQCNETMSRKRRDLSVEEKIELLKEYDAFPKMPQREAATKLNISQSVLCTLLKNRGTIRDGTAKNENIDRKRKRTGKR